MSEGSVPGSSPNTSNKVMLRNIITGVITTVAGATVIYFLGFHNKGEKSSPPEYLVVKDATINGWRSYVSAENVFFGNWNVYAANYTSTGFERYKQNTLGELNRFKSDMKKILETKNLDPSFTSLLERRLEAKEDWENKYKKHLDNYERIDKATTDQSEKTTKLNAEVQHFGEETKDIDQRFANEIGELCNALTSKYGCTFSWKELRMYQQLNTNNQTDTSRNRGTGGITNTDDWRKLVGKWHMIDKDKGANVGTLYQYDDGRMYYYFLSGDSTYGRWQYGNNQLTLYYDKYWGAGYNFIYNVSEISDNSFTMKLTTTPNSVFTATRTN